MRAGVGERTDKDDHAAVTFSQVALGGEPEWRGGAALFCCIAGQNLAPRGEESFSCSRPSSSHSSPNITAWPIKTGVLSCQECQTQGAVTRNRRVLGRYQGVCSRASSSHEILLALSWWLRLSSASASCFSLVRALRGVLQPLTGSREPGAGTGSRAASELEINAFKTHKSMKISRSQSKDPSFTTWMFEPRFFSVI